MLNKSAVRHAGKWTIKDWIRRKRRSTRLHLYENKIGKRWEAGGGGGGAKVQKP